MGSGKPRKTAVDELAELRPHYYKLLEIMRNQKRVIASQLVELAKLRRESD